MVYSVYIPRFDLLFEATTTRPDIFRHLCGLPDAVFNPPIRDDGYRIADDADEFWIEDNITRPS